MAQTPAQVIQYYIDNAPAVTGAAMAQYWVGALVAAGEGATLEGIDVNGAEWKAAVADALAPYGLSPFAGAVLPTMTQIPESQIALTQDGLFHLGNAASQLYLGGTKQAVYAEGGDDRLTVTSSAYTTNTFLLDGGAGDDTLLGGSGSDWLDGGAGADLMAGGGGDDTYVVDSVDDLVLESIYGGTDTVRASISHTLDDNIEGLTLLGTAALTGTGNELANTLTGNAAANRLWGLAGNDTLDGGAGADTMAGGQGSDVYIVDNAGDVVVEQGAASYDEIRTTVDYTLARGVEYLTLLGTANLRGYGNSAGNKLTGNSGDNYLDGRSGADTMSGGLGNDTYVVDNVYDSVVEAANGGNDTVYASLDYALSANQEIESLILTGSNDLNGTGNTLNNRLVGNGGDNILDGAAGSDTMAGGNGDDIYIVDDAGDVVQETSTGGRDGVRTSLATYTLSDNVEDLTLYKSGLDAVSRSGTGNALSNSILGTNGVNTLAGLDGNDSLYGYDGNDVLEGGAGNDVMDGGTGQDTMTGGTGNDVYSVDDSGDRIVEGVGAGTDSVQASSSYVLSDNIERLQLTGGYNLDGTGNGSANLLTGNTGNNVLDGRGGADTMAGGLGNDTYVVDNLSDSIVEVAGAGTDLVRSGVSITLGDNLENLTLLGTGNLQGYGNAVSNIITGNSGANVLRGYDGDDTLDGGLGNDSLYGGLGRDVYIVNSSGDLVIEGGSGGNEAYDEVRASVSYTLLARVENLVLTGTANINGSGNTLANRLTGNSGNNVLDGKYGVDTMSGGLGDDTYYVDNSYDSVVEASGEGNDRIISSVSYTLGAYSHVEALVLTGTDDLTGTGNGLANTLTGNGGDNVLNGGTGADTMAGGAGDDTYVVDETGDVVTELADGGIDEVMSSVNTYTLGANVENLTLYTGYIDAIARSGTGNALDNIITGSNGANTLSGLDGDDTLEGNDGNDALIGGNGADWLDGGAGNDTLTGGAGDDVFVVDSALDSVVEAAGGGTDTVRASVSYTLAANVETLRLTGSGTIDGSGNALDNRLFGNSGNNVLNGGAGADRMNGGAGNDTYIVDNAGDRVYEALGGGTDTVQSSVSYTLGVGVERLTLVGSGALNGTGNELDNVLVGTSGGNTLTGGFGADTMTGGAGADRFVWNATGESPGLSWAADVITDFSGAEGDVLDFSGVDARSATAGNEAFTFIGASNFSGAGQLRAVTSGNTVWLAANTDADTTTVEMWVRLDGISSFNSGWLVA